MLDLRDRRYLLSHHALHRSWLLLLAYFAYTVAPGTLPWLAEMACLVPLMASLSLLSLSQFVHSARPRGGKAFLAWTFLAMALAWLGLAALKSLAAGQSLAAAVLAPDRALVIGTASILACAWLDWGLERAWAERKYFYGRLGDPGLVLHQALHPHQKLLQDVWRKLTAREDALVFMLASTWIVAVFPLSSASTLPLALAHLGLVLMSGVALSAVLNAQRFEHRLFELNCYPAGAGGPGLLRWRLALPVLAFGLALLVPTMPSLLPGDTAFAALARLLALFAISGGAGQRVFEEIEENLKQQGDMQPYAVIQPALSAAGGDSGWFARAAFWIVLGALVLLGLGIPLWRMRRGIPGAIRRFWFALRAALRVLLRRAPSAAGKALAPRKAVSARSLLRDGLRARPGRSPSDSQVIRQFVHWLEAWERRGLSLQQSDTPREILARIAALPAWQGLDAGQASSLARLNRSVGDALLTELFGARPLDEAGRARLREDVRAVDGLLAAADRSAG